MKLRNWNIALVALLALAISPQVLSSIPLIIPYSGSIKVDGELFTGQGQFKFAIVDENCAGNNDTCKSIWSNDNSSVTGSEPRSAVAADVTNGQYKILLGDVSLANMSELLKISFDSEKTYLRIWFNDGTNGSQLLTPDQRFTSVAYAYHANIADTVPAGSIGVNEIDSRQIQRRGSLTACSNGEAMREITEEGNVVCSPSTGVAKLNAGNGVQVVTEEDASITISLSEGANTIKGSCPNGSISAIGENGNISCTDNTTLSAGEGISIVDGVISSNAGFTSEKVIAAVNSSNNINAHHKRYTDVEAVAAINASINDVVAFHQRYTDQEAVSAINAASEQITAHHERYSDDEVLSVITNNINNTPALHSKYSDDDAINAINTAGDKLTILHQRYSDVEAVAAINASNEITAHHERYSDDEAINAINNAGDRLTVMHERYTNAEVISTINASNEITAHHPRYTNAEVLSVIADNIDQVAGIHSRYSDAEAVSAINNSNNIDADSLSGLAASDFVQRSGNQSFANNTLYVDADNGRIGVGTNQPSDSLEINGNVVANNFVLKQAQKGYLNLPANGFPNVSRYEGWDVADGYIEPFTENQDLRALIPVSLPHGAELTDISCEFSVRQLPPFGNMTEFVRYVSFQFIQHEKRTINYATLFAETATNPQHSVETQLLNKDTRDAISGEGVIVDNSKYRYSIKLEMNTKFSAYQYGYIYDSHARIYGCDFEYFEATL